jgi:hypothetical protein
MKVVIIKLAKNKSFDEYIDDMHKIDQERKERKFKKYFTLKGKIFEVAKSNCIIF